MRYIVLLLLFGILLSLGSGLFYLVRDKGHSDRTVRALTWRIGLSMLLFALLMLAYGSGWVSGHLFQ